MSNILAGYLNKRLSQEKKRSFDSWNTPGPVITISREVGCNGLVVANDLAERLNKKHRPSHWQVLSKEIFLKSAKELSLETDHVRRIFKQSDKFIFEDILKAFNNRNYKSEQKIINTVIDVVRSFAIDGFCILVGRAGHIIASDIENALHLRFTAPLEYRIKNIQNNNDLNRDEAIRFIAKVEKERMAFRKVIKAETSHDEIFDLSINRASFTSQQAIDMIEMALDQKGIMKDIKSKIQYY